MVYGASILSSFAGLRVVIVLTSAVSSSDSGATSGLGLLDAFLAGLGLLDAFVSTATGGDTGASGVVTLSSAIAM